MPQLLRKAFLRAMILGILFAAQSAFAFSSEAELKKALERPLITGASVSADTGTLSPGKRLALQYTSQQKIKTVAVGGSPGFRTIQALKEKDLKDRSSI